MKYKYMLDTNTCSYVRDHVQSVLKKFIEKRADGLCISAITLAEMRYGVEKTNSYAKNKRSLELLLNRLVVLPFDEAAANEYGLIRAYLRGIGKPIGDMDNLIAGHARALGLTIVTNNVREFERVPDLKIENWYE